MRIDAREPGYVPSWKAWHAERCEFPKLVVWVDSETAQWAQYVEPTILSGLRVNQARRIDINVELKFITINPIEGVDDVGEITDATLELLRNLAKETVDL
jgi:hypothetical protein